MFSRDPITKRLEVLAVRGFLDTWILQFKRTRLEKIFCIPKVESVATAERLLAEMNNGLDISYSTALKIVTHAAEE